MTDLKDLRILLDIILKGRLNPLTKIGFACVLLWISTREHAMLWQRILFVILGLAFLIWATKSFWPKWPCKERMKSLPGCKDLSRETFLCTRDFGYFAGIGLVSLLVYFAGNREWSLVVCRQISVWPWHIFLLFMLILSLPTVLHGTLRRLGIIKGRRAVLTMVILFVCGFLNAVAALLAAIWFFF